jgi:hypothetical protein
MTLVGSRELLTLVSNICNIRGRIVWDESHAESPYESRDCHAFCHFRAARPRIAPIAALFSAAGVDAPDG